MPAATFLGSIGDPQAYESSAQVLKVAGLSLVERSSGLLKGKERISKRGRPTLRRHAFMFALRGVRTGGMYHDEFLRLLANNGGKKMSALTAISRKGFKLMFTIACAQRAYVPPSAKVRGVPQRLTEDVLAPRVNELLAV